MENQNDKYSFNDKLFAILSLIAGTVSVFCLFTSGLGLPATISFLIIISLAVFNCFYNKQKCTSLGVILFIISVALSVSLSLFGNVFIKICTILLLMLLLPCLIYVSGNNVRFNDPYYFFDLIKAIYISPFIAFGKWFTSLFRAKSKGDKNFLYAVIGICAAIPLLIIVIALLISADAAFENLFNNIFENFFDNILEYIFKFLMILPISCTLFSCLNASHNKRTEKFLNNESCEYITNTIRKLPVITVLFIVVPLCIVYFAFFATQLSYFTSAFGGILPEGITYSDYARRGFFELCAVGFINLLIIIAISVFIRRKNTKFGIEKILILLLSLITLGLTAISASKMVLYINAYGMTQLRIYVMWFIILMCATLVCISVKQFSQKFKLLFSCSIITVLMSIIIVFANVDCMIAKYNVNAYKTGRIHDLDVEAFYELDDSASVYLIDLETNDNELKGKIDQYLATISCNFDRDTEFGDLNIATMKAKTKIEKLNLESIVVELSVDSYVPIKSVGWDAISNGKTFSSAGATRADEEEFYYDTFFITLNKNDIPEDANEIVIKFFIDTAEGTKEVRNDFTETFKLGKTYNVSIGYEENENGDYKYIASLNNEK